MYLYVLLQQYTDELLHQTFIILYAPSLAFSYVYPGGLFFFNCIHLYKVLQLSSSASLIRIFFCFVIYLIISGLSLYLK